MYVLLEVGKRNSQCTYGFCRSTQKLNIDLKMQQSNLNASQTANNAQPASLSSKSCRHCPWLLQCSSKNN